MALQSYIPTSTVATPAISTFDGFRNTTATTTTLADLPRLFELARPLTVQALGAKVRNDDAGYERAKHQLPCICPAHFDGTRAAANVRGFATVVVEFDAPADKVRAARAVWPHLQHIEGLAAAWATGKGFRFVFVVEAYNGTADQCARAYEAQWRVLSKELSERFAELGPADAKAAPVSQIAAVWAVPAHLVGGCEPYINPYATPRLLVAVPDPEPELTPIYNVRSSEPNAGVSLDQLQEIADSMQAWPTKQRYADWRKLTIALANVFGPAAEPLAVQLATLGNAQWTADEAPRKTAALFRRALHTSYAGGIGALVNVFKAQGIKLPTTAPRGEEEELARPTATRFDVVEYISETAAALNEYVHAATGAVLVQAPTGAGKTTWAVEFAKTLALDAARCEVVAIILPTAHNVADKGREYALPAVREGYSTANLGLDYDAGFRVFFTTPDALPKFDAAGLTVRHVFVDEAHDLPHAEGYRPAAVRAIMALATGVVGAGGRCVLMTATPQSELVRALQADAFPLNLATVRVKKAADVVLQTAVGDYTALVIAVVGWVRMGRRVLVSIDRKVGGRAGRVAVANVYEALRAAGVAVGYATRERTAGISDFQAGRIDVLVGTRIINESYNVHADSCECVAVHVALNGCDPEALVQLGGRFRRATRVHLVQWALGNGAYLNEYSQRDHIEGAGRFDAGANLTAHRNAALNAAGRIGKRQWAQVDTVGAGRAADLVDTNDHVAPDPVAYAGRAIADRCRRGGIEAALAAVSEYTLGRCEWAGELETDTLADSVRTQFDAACKEFDEGLKAWKPADVLSFALTAVRLAAGPDAERAGELAARWGIATGSDLLAVARASMRAAGLSVEVGDETDRHLGLYILKLTTPAAGLIGLMKLLPQAATRRDALRLVEAVQREGFTASGVSTTRRRFAAAYALEGRGEVPFEAFGSLTQAEFLSIVQQIRAAVPALQAATAGRLLTGLELATLVRERTGVVGGLKVILAALRCCCEVKRVSGRREGKVTTLFEVGAAVTFADFGQTWDAGVEFGARYDAKAAKAMQGGATAVFMRSYSVETTPAPNPPETEPWWAFLGAPPPTDTPF